DAAEGQWPFMRPTNRAGGVEGGVSNGEPIVARLAMKPIPTLMSPLRSVDVRTGGAAEAHAERSDVCAVPAAGVVAEAMMALVLASACRAKFGGDGIEDMRAAFGLYLLRLGLPWSDDE
ncbi:MAG TPA: chorismate synthase, partial [Armatimonadota bacterium]|nr:chorismate synthase [Armatimonadota bacterium]